MNRNTDWDYRVTRARQELRRPAHLEADVVRATGITERTLDNWIIRQIIEPAGGAPGKGGRRQYSALDAVKVAIIAGLVDVGLVPQHAARIAECAADWLIEAPRVIHYETFMATLPAVQLVVTPEMGQGRIECPPQPIEGRVNVVLDLADLVRTVITVLYEPYRLIRET